MIETNSAQDLKNTDASSYNPLANHFEHYSQIVTKPVVPELLNLVNLKNNTFLLDIGTGTGIVAHSAAKIIGRENCVWGIDYSEGMLETARSQNSGKFNPNFLQMDAEGLTFDDSTFDVITSLYVLRHLPNPEDAIAEMYRVLKPNGQIVIGIGSGVPRNSIKLIKAIAREIWVKYESLRGRYAHACNLIDDCVREVINTNENLAQNHHSTEHTFSNQALIDWFKKAGFRNIQSSWIGNQFQFDSIEDFWLLQSTFSSFARKILLDASPEKYEQVKRKFFENCEEVLKNKGRLEYQTGTYFINASK